MSMDSSLEWVILGDELMALVRERVAAGHKVRYLPFAGVSMRPLLRAGRDTVELAPLPEKLKKYDLPVYQYPSGKYVMHRVVEVREDHYLCLGDNTYRYEKIYPEQMVALVTAFKRGERRIEVDSRPYRVYCRIWVAIYPLRRRLRRLYVALKPLVKRILGALGVKRFRK